jgi:predicted nucleotidyltransferase
MRGYSRNVRDKCGSLGDDMKTLDEIRTALRAQRPVLEREYGVTRLAVFGSYARSEQTEESDVDILVEFREPLGLRFVHLADLLERALGMKVDLLAPDSIKPNRRPHILTEVCPVWGMPGPVSSSPDENCVRIGER